MTGLPDECFATVLFIVEFKPADLNIIALSLLYVTRPAIPSACIIESSKLSHHWIVGLLFLAAAETLDVFRHNFIFG